MRILLSVYACEPNKGSEPGVGWDWAKHLAKDCDVIAITRKNNKSNIEKINDDHRIKFIYHDIDWLSKYKKRIPLGTQIYYTLWQLTLVRLVIQIHRITPLNFVHHITFNGFTYPTFLSFTNIPFIWGPIGGGQISPPSLRYLFGKKRLKENIRSLWIKLSRYNLLFIFNCRKAVKIICANNDTINRIPLGYKSKVIKMIEIGKEIAENKVPIKNEIFEILWVGSLEPHKAPLLAIKAIEKILISKKEVLLTIIGSGSLKGSLTKYIQNRHLKKYVHLLGQVAHEKLYSHYKRSDIFLFTSLRDTSGNVLLEAMSYGLPCISFNHQGSKEILDDSCGILINITSIRQILDDLGAKIIWLQSNPKIRFEMGRNAVEKVRLEFFWNKKVMKMKSIYEELSNENITSS